MLVQLKSRREKKKIDKNLGLGCGVCAEQRKAGACCYIGEAHAVLELAELGASKRQSQPQLLSIKAQVLSKIHAV